METKFCKSCSEDKPIKDFGEVKNTKDGLNVYCRKCCSEKYKAWKLKNQQKVIDWRLNNKEDLNLSRKRNKKWRDDNPEKYKTLVQNNNLLRKESKKKYYRDKYHNDIEYKTKRKLRSQLTHFLNGKVKSKSTFELLGYSFEDFMSKFGDVMNSFLERQEIYHIDHKIPIDWFVLEAPIDLVFNLENLQIISQSENNNKKGYYPSPCSEEFLGKIKKFIKKEFICW